MQGGYIEINRNGGKYTRSVKNHQVVHKIRELYETSVDISSEIRYSRGQPRQTQLPPISEIVTQDNNTTIIEPTMGATPIKRSVRGKKVKRSLLQTRRTRLTRTDKRTWK